MAEHDTSRSLVEQVAKKVKDAVTNPDLERGLTNGAAAMPAAAGDLNFAGAASPAGGPSVGFTPGAGAAAGGSLTDDEPVGKAGESDHEPDR
jgi:hypothetical protein